MVQGYEATGGYRHIVGGSVVHSRPFLVLTGCHGASGLTEKEAESGARGPGGPGPGVRMDLLVCPSLSLQGTPSEKEGSELLSDPWGIPGVGWSFRGQGRRVRAALPR